MTDRKLTCVACKSAITKGDIAHSDLEFGGELKATNQPEYTAGADTNLIATIGMLDEYTPMVRTSGNQHVLGYKIMDTGIYGHVGYHGRLANLTKAGVCDIAYTPSETYQNCKLWLTVRGRYTQFDGHIDFQIQPDGSITNPAAIGNKLGEDNFTYLFLYKIADYNKIRVAIGNLTSTNNNLQFNSNGGIIGAGFDMAIDYSIMGTDVTAEITDQTVSVKIGE